MRAKLSELLLLCLAEELYEKHPFYRSSAAAYRQLKHLTGQDFGYDIDAWREWFEHADKRFPNLNKPMDDEI